jgi:hypothetical protein
MAINNYSDSDFYQLQVDHAKLKTDFAVALSVISAMQKDQDKMESKFDRQMDSLRGEIKELNTKLDMLIDLANQAKGAGQASKIMWVLGTVLLSGLGWFITNTLGVKLHP